MIATAIAIPELPAGWRWYRSMEGRSFREKRSSEGHLTACYDAWMYDPADEQLYKDGNFATAEGRGTARLFVVTPADLAKAEIRNPMELEALLPDE